MDEATKTDKEVTDKEVTDKEVTDKEVMKEARQTASWLVLVSLIISIPLWGLAVSNLWGWFVFGTFTTATMPWWQASGIGCLVMLLRGGVRPQNEDDAEKILRSGLTQAAALLGRPLFLLAIGAVLRLFA